MDDIKVGLEQWQVRLLNWDFNCRDIEEFKPCQSRRFVCLNDSLSGLKSQALLLQLHLSSYGVCVLVGRPLDCRGHSRPLLGHFSAAITVKSLSPLVNPCSQGMWWPWLGFICVFLPISLGRLNLCGRPPPHDLGSGFLNSASCSRYVLHRMRLVNYSARLSNELHSRNTCTRVSWTRILGTTVAGVEQQGVEG